MFTVCPKCALTLVVTAADLRVAQGYVRCGRCSSVFNALARLSDERQAAAEQEISPLSSSQAEGSAQEADLSPLEEALRPSAEEGSEAIPEGALEFNPDTTDVGTVFVEPPPNPQWTAATGSFKAMRNATQAPEPPVSAAPTDSPSRPDESQVDVEIDAAFLADMLGEAAPESETQHEPQSPRAESPRAEPQSPHAEPQSPPPLPAQPTRPAPPPRAMPAASSATSAPTSKDSPAGSMTQPTAGAAPARPTPSGLSVRPAARHGLPHTRPATQASAHSRVMPTKQRTPRSHAAPVTRVPEDTAASLESAASAIAPRPSATRALLARVDTPMWGAAAALALLVLLAQIVNHNRDELAANPRFSRPLTALYGSLGVRLMPHWDVRAYDVRQLGASADSRGSGLITVRASIKNAGSQAQPLPLLRVTLQDRFGNRIAARDVAPRFYVPHTIPDSSYLASGQRIDAEMGFIDPGANAVGFEIDACLPASGGGVTCANDLAAR